MKNKILIIAYAIALCGCSTPKPNIEKTETNAMANPNVIGYTKPATWGMKWYFKGIHNQPIHYGYRSDGVVVWQYRGSNLPAEFSYTNTVE